MIILNNSNIFWSFFYRYYFNHGYLFVVKIIYATLSRKITRDVPVYSFSMKTNKYELENVSHNL